MSGNPQELCEQTLVVRRQIGDEAAFEELVRSYGPRLLLFARKMMQTSPERIEDLMQEVWLAVYRGLPSLLDVTKFRPWAFRIARDRIYREFRRRKLPVEAMHEMELADVPDAEQRNGTITPEELHRGLDRISASHREVFMLHYLEEMSYEEVARVIECSIGTVRSRIHYGKRALKDALQRNL